MNNPCIALLRYIVWKKMHSGHYSFLAELNPAYTLLFKAGLIVLITTPSNPPPPPSLTNYSSLTISGFLDTSGELSSSTEDEVAGIFPTPSPTHDFKTKFSIHNRFKSGHQVRA